MKNSAIFLLILTAVLGGCLSEAPQPSSTNNPGVLNVGASFGPDGSWIVFSSTRNGGGGNLFRLDLAATRAVDLTTETTDEWTTPSSVSPDGTMLLYETNRTGNYSLWLKNFSNGALGVFKSGGSADLRHPAWSQDGQKVAYAKRGDQSAYSKIYVVHRDGSAEKAVSTGEFHDFRPSWTRDGRIVFYRYIGTQTDLILVDPDQPLAGEINLTRSNDVDEFDPCCAHFSDQVYFCRGKINGGPGRVVAMGLDSTNPTYLTQADGHYRDVSLSRDDTKLIWVHQAGEGASLDLYLANAAGTVIRRLTNGSEAPAK